MAELGPYLSLYEERVDKTISRTQENLNKWNDRLETYNTLYPKVLKTADDLGILETFQKLFPEGGGSPSFGSQAIELSNLYSYGEDSLPIKALDKVANSPQRTVKLANRIEELNQWKGKGEDYLKKLQHSISLKLAKVASTNPNSFDKLMSMTFSEYDTYENVVDFSDIEIDGPSGVKSSEITYALLKEKYESGEYGTEKKETEEDKDQISNNTAIGNDIEEDIDEAGGLESLAINNNIELEVPDENTILDGSSTDGETEKQVTSLNIESSGALNIPDEKITKKEESLKQPPDNKDLNVVDTKPDTLEDVSKETVPSTETINNITSNKSINEENISIDSPVSPVNSDIPKKKKGKFGKFLGKIGGGISKMYQSSDLSKVVNSISKDVNTFKSNSPINNFLQNINNKDIKNETSSNDLSSTTNTGAVNTLSPISKQIKEGDVLGAITSNVSNMQKNNDILSSQKQNISESIIDKSSNFKSLNKSSIVSPEPITKDDISNVGKDISSSVSNAAAPSDLNIPIKDKVIPKESSNKSIPLVKNDNENTQNSGETVVQNLPSDFSQMEKRLKNIELLLMSPLEVKIKN